MKTLKFTPELCALIIAGKKTATWRFFDDKDLQVGDTLMFINSVTTQSIGTGVITKTHTKTLATLTESDWLGHERFVSQDAMYATYRSYYGDNITPHTAVKLHWFTFVAN